MRSWFKRYARFGLALVVALLLLAAFGGAQPAAASGPVYHVVHPGETLYSIAVHYGVTVYALQCANGIWNPNYIQAGMKLFIPFGWAGACKTHGPIIIIVNPPDDHHQQPPPKPCDCIYRVRWGDTLYSIAWRYHTTVWELQQMNHLGNPNMIFAGMNLRVPCERDRDW